MSGNGLVVWKYRLDVDDWFELDMPIGAEVIHFDLQMGRPRLWALVDPSADTEPRLFRFAGTGHSIQKPTKNQRITHRGSVLIDGGKLVFHLFEWTEDDPVSDPSPKGG